MKLLQLYFSFNGRLSLKDFWLYWVLPLYLGGAVIFYLLENVFHYPNAQYAIAFFLYAPFTPNVIFLFLCWPLLAVYAKRLHDRNLSGWFLLLRLIPILGSIILFIPIYLTPGTEKETRYDPGYKERHPEEFLNTRRKAIIVVSVLIAFQVLCFFGNKSILCLIYTDGPYYGRVVDAGTGEPIAGAAVAGVWEFNHNSFFGSSSSFAGAKETVTDQEGNFYLELNWAYTSRINTEKLKISNLYVFKSGYDSHPPYMQKYWSKEDEKRRNMTRGEYQFKYKKRCEPQIECIVELTPTQTEMERSSARAGAKIDGLPLRLKSKIRNYISIVNVERKKAGRKEWRIE